MRVGVEPSCGAFFAGRGDDVAGLDEGGVAAAALGHQLARVDAELVDVELVVGEQHEVLEMLRAGRRVVRQPVQRIVDALRGERRQRQRLARDRSNVPLAMWSSVPLRSGTSNMSRSGRLMRSAADASTWVPSRKAKCSGIGVADSETTTGTPWLRMIRPQLLEQIAFEQVRPGDGRRKMAGRRHMAVGDARVDLR